MAPNGFEDAREDALNATRFFHHQDARLAAWVRNMFTTYFSEKNIADAQSNYLLKSIDSAMHIDLSIKDRKNFFTIIDVPFVGLVCPVNPRCDAIHVGHIQGAPSSIGREFFAADDFHGQAFRLKYRYSPPAVRCSR